MSNYGVFSGPLFPAFGQNSISPESVRMRENTDQKKLRIWTLSTQWMFSFFISISILFSVLLLLCVSTRTSVFLLKNIICFQKIVDKKTDEWYIGWQGVAMSGSTSDNEWQRVATNDNKWKRVTARGKTNENSTVYFKECMIAIFSVTKTNAQLHGMDGCN